MGIAWMRRQGLALGSSPPFTGSASSANRGYDSRRSQAFCSYYSLSSYEPFPILCPAHMATPNLGPIGAVVLGVT